MNRPVIQTEVYLKRIATMQKLVQDNNLDLVLIASDEAEPANVRYFTGYVPKFETTAIMIPAVGEAVLLIGPESEALVQRNSRLPNYRKLLEFRETSDPEYPDIAHSTFREVFDGIAGKQCRIGIIGGNVMTLQVYLGVLEGAGNAEIVRCDELLRQMRMIKTPEEIEIMHYTAQIAERGFKRALERIHPGMTELEAMEECNYGIMMEGAEGPGFPFWVVCGKNTNQAIGRSTFDVIEKNKIIQISMGAMYEGYTVSYGRPFSFGNPSDQALEILKLGLEANKMTHRILRPGIPASEVADKVHGFVRESGYGEYIVYGPCHGNGMMECEWPFIESTSDYIIQPNMTYAVDTFLGGEEFGMRYEDGAVVTENGSRAFSQPQQEIIIL